MGNMVSKCNDLKMYGGFVASVGLLMVGAYAYGGLPPIGGLVGAGMFIAGGIAAGVGIWGEGKACN